MKKQHKILALVLVVMAIYNPSRKDYAAQFGVKGIHFKSYNFILFTVFSSRYYCNGMEVKSYQNKSYTIGILGNLIRI